MFFYEGAQANQNARVRHFLHHGFPLPRLAQHAALHVVLGNMTLDDAARTAGVTPDALVHEVLAWAAAADFEDTEDL